MRGFFQSVDPSIEVIVEPRPRSDKLEGSLEILERTESDRISAFLLTEEANRRTT